jgi:hypothetical protein
MAARFLMPSRIEQEDERLSGSCCRGQPKTAN